MKLTKAVLILIFLSVSFGNMYSQDTVRLTKKPKVILHSWYPEYKASPKLKIGESKLVFTILPGLYNTPFGDNYIYLTTTNSNVQIENTPKSDDQYVITVNATEAKYIEFEAWVDLEGKIVLIKDAKGKWRNIKELYTVKENRWLVDKIRLEVVK
ncbi:hypothetical protein [Flavobacterium hungaricum]|uniref:Uncharacterized protein n=1 Tax=Flavobacterium hungaricum TaxID=2082725 RepID=A0ABR9TRV3_9FLAO|nr:hypothetical protein [Flavobacterium hungaricum]MBE8728099.1 hypothetical protein [Flavobacterium hungaricum]